MKTLFLWIVRYPGPGQLAPQREGRAHTFESKKGGRKRSRLVASVTGRKV